jgi:hypothetical protein
MSARVDLRAAVRRALARRELAQRPPVVRVLGVPGFVFLRRSR